MIDRSNIQIVDRKVQQKGPGRPYTGRSRLPKGSFYYLHILTSEQRLMVVHSLTVLYGIALIPIAAYHFANLLRVLFSFRLYVYWVYSVYFYFSWMLLKNILHKIGKHTIYPQVNWTINKVIEFKYVYMSLLNCGWNIVPSCKIDRRWSNT